MFARTLVGLIRGALIFAIFIGVNPAWLSGLPMSILSAMRPYLLSVQHYNTYAQPRACYDVTSAVKVATPKHAHLCGVLENRKLNRRKFSTAVSAWHSTESPFSPPPVTWTGCSGAMFLPSSFS